MVRFDMSEFQERHTVSRLVGAPPGYVGYEEAGQLTEAVRRRPYSVLLFDEIEKAHPDVFNILLQILDDGRLTDAQGRTVDFKNTIVIMTSNLGADRIQAVRAHRRGLRAAEGRADADPAQSFRPEFINRIDEIIVFRALDRRAARGDHEAAARPARPAAARAADRGRVHRRCRRAPRREGFDPEFGARPLRRTIQRLVENELSRHGARRRDRARRPVHRDVPDGELHFEVETGGAAELLDAEEERQEEPAASARVKPPGAPAKPARPRSAPPSRSLRANSRGEHRLTPCPADLRAELRDTERVMPLELFFDLVFVLAITQCTALMADDPTWEGCQGLLVLGVLWWAWVGLRVADQRRRPGGGRRAAHDVRRDGRVARRRARRPRGVRRRRAALRVAYGVVRAAHIALFVIAAGTTPRSASRSRPRGHGGRRRAARRRASSTAARRGAVGRRARARHGRAVLLRLRGLAPRAGPLRRAARADRDHRPRRVDRRDRRRRGIASTPASSPRRCWGSRSPRRSGGSTSTSSRSSPSAASSPAGRERNERARLLLVPPLPDGRRDRPGRPRVEEDARHVGEPLGMCGGRAARRGGVYLLAHVAFRLRTSARVNRQRLVARSCCSRSPARRASPRSRPSRS